MPPARLAILRSLFRLAVVIGLAVLVNLALNALLEQLNHSPTKGGRLMLNGVLVLSLILYALLMAMPFVPSIEIGISLLMMQGPGFAPVVFLATFTGLSLSFLVGRFLPYRILHSFFVDLGFGSVSRLLERIEPLERDDRLALLQSRLPRFLVPVLVKYRYLTLALALNIPGNSVIGGGGGIAMLAGLSGMFSTRAALATIALAVAPVPLLIYGFGFDFLKLLNG